MVIRKGLMALLAASTLYAADNPGQSVFRSNCAFCHGQTGEGGRGPNLVSGRPTHGSTPEAITKVIHEGVPGTTMPSFQFKQDEMGALVAYVIGLRAQSKGVVEKPEGDPAKGRQVYARLQCANCHQIGNEGSVFGPELTRIGAARSLAYLRTSITNPSADIPPEYEGVRVTTKDGAKVTGVLLNEDTFSVQLRDNKQQFRMFEKSRLSETTPLKQSLMPAYGNLPADQLNDLLAYLDTLRGDSGSGAVKQATGIK